MIYRLKRHAIYINTLAGRSVANAQPSCSPYGTHFVVFAGAAVEFMSYISVSLTWS